MHMGLISLIKCLCPSVADDLHVVKDYSPTRVIGCRMEHCFPRMNSIPGLYAIVLLCTT